VENRRSPYLILGVPYGASKGDAAKAFAKATRRLRKTSDAPYDIEDLNWALHAVEQRADDPSTSIDDFRMPANSVVYEVPHGEGLLYPKVEPLARLTSPTSAADVELLKAALIREVAADLAQEFEGAPLPALHRFSEEGS
jgi:hypothetical protein